MLVVDTPILDPNSLKVLIIGYIDKFHTVIFTIECLIKIIGLGFFRNTLYMLIIVIEMGRPDGATEQTKYKYV